MSFDPDVEIKIALAIGAGAEIVIAVTAIMLVAVIYTKACVTRRGQSDLDGFAACWGAQIAPVGAREAKLWGQLLGAKEKNKDDIGLVATAKLHGWTPVTRNIDHCAGYGVRLLNPFKKPLLIIEPD